MRIKGPFSCTMAIMLEHAGPPVSQTIRGSVDGLSWDSKYT